MLFSLEVSNGDSVICFQRGLGLNRVLKIVEGALPPNPTFGDVEDVIIDIGEGENNPKVKDFIQDKTPVSVFTGSVFSKDIISSGTSWILYEAPVDAWLAKHAFQIDIGRSDGGMRAFTGHTVFEDHIHGHVEGLSYMLDLNKTANIEYFCRSNKEVAPQRNEGIIVVTNASGEEIGYHFTYQRKDSQRIDEHEQYGLMYNDLYNKMIGISHVKTVSHMLYRTPSKVLNKMPDVKPTRTKAKAK